MGRQEAWETVPHRMTQVFTGHECFGKYLSRIAKEPMARCHHCAADRDTAQHTLKECPVWDEQRDALVTIVDDLSLPALVKAISRR